MIIKNNSRVDKEDSRDYVNNFVIEGYRTTKIDDVFLQPANSRKVGIFKVLEVSNQLSAANMEEFQCKCVLLNVKNASYAVASLHS